MDVTPVKSTSSSAEEISLQHVQILNVADDSFVGVVVEMKEPMNLDVFDTLLRASISQWRKQVQIYSY